MMTHAYLNILANLHPFNATVKGGTLLSCGFSAYGSTSASRFVFATHGSSGGSSGSPEKNEEEKKKEEEEKKKKETEEAEKKKKEEEEKKKKQKKEKEGGEEGEEKENLDTTQQRISKMARSAIESSEKLKKEIERSDSEKQRANAEKMGKVGREFQAINREDEKAQQPVKDYLSELVTRKKITKAEAQTLLNLDPADDDFRDEWKKALKKIPGLDAESPEAKKLLELKEKEGVKVKELDKRLKKAMSELRDLTKEMGDALIKKAHQERELKALERATGLNVKKEQKLKYRVADEKEEKPQTAAIREVTFETVDIQDEKGNVVQKIQTNTPVVIVESLNPNTNQISVDTFNSAEFHQWVDEYDVLEDIDSYDKLTKSIGVELKEGNVVEYQEVEFKENEKEVRTDVKVEIKKLDKDKRKITLDKDVETKKGIRKKEFSFDEFAKWFKQREVMKEVENIEKLRHELHAFNEKQNSFYERSPAQYPPIEVKDGEVLYYDDGTEREFFIKKVHEKEKMIEFEDGKKMTYTGFLRWVKRNEVEKRTGDAEAHKASDHIADPDEKKAEFEKQKAQTEQDLDEKKKGIMEKPGNAVLESPDEHAHVPMGYFRKLWRDTQFLSISDLGEMAKTIWELIKRRWARRQKGRIGIAGRMMFGHYSTALGAEFKSIAQSAENEEVNHHVHVMETMGIEDIKHELHEPPDKDTLKAAITVMCKKGQMRWDDHHFWHAVETFSGEAIRPDHHLEDLERIIDGWWGQDTFREFRNSQDSSYNSIKKNFEDNATRLENDPSGLRGELRRLLYNFINGEYVNPCQYEEYLDYSMKAGKMAFEDKMFFLIMGVGATNPNGETLLHLDRIAALEGSYLNTIPLIDFFVSPWHQRLDANGNRIWDPEKGEYKTGRPDLNTFKGWIKKYIQPDIPGKKLESGSLKSPTDVYWKQDSWPKGTRSIFSDFVRDKIAWDKYASFRAEKAARDPSNWDHDDMDMFVQLLDEGTIDQITRIAGGARQQVSTTGIKNAFAGMNEFIRREIENLDKTLKWKKNIEKMSPGSQRDLDLKEAQEEINEHYKRIVKMLKAFVMFDATIDTRYNHSNENKVRFSESTYNSPPLCSDALSVRGFINEVRGVLKGLSDEFGMGDQFVKVHENIPSTRKNEWDAQNTAIKDFNQNLSVKMNEYLENNGIENLSSMLSRMNTLTGLIDKKTERKEAGKEELEEMQTAQSKKTVNDNADSEISMAA